jgi:hypothetical protein
MKFKKAISMLLTFACVLSLVYSTPASASGAEFSIDEFWVTTRKVSWDGTGMWNNEPLTGSTLKLTWSDVEESRITKATAQNYPGTNVFTASMDRSFSITASNPFYGTVNSKIIGSISENISIKSAAIQTAVVDVPLSVETEGTPHFLTYGEPSEGGMRTFELVPFHTDNLNQITIYGTYVIKIILSNDAEYYFIFDSQVSGSSKSGPSFVTLYDRTIDEILGTDFQISPSGNNNNLYNHKYGALSGSPILAPLVYNSGVMPEASVGSTVANWQWTQENYISVNGEQLGKFYSGSGDLNHNILGPDFTLKNGINIVLVTTYAPGMYLYHAATKSFLNRQYPDSPPTAAQQASACTTVAFIIDYSGENIQPQEHGDDFSLAEFSVYKHQSSNGSIYHTLPVALSNDPEYDFVASGIPDVIDKNPGGYTGPDDIKLLFMIKPVDGMAEVEFDGSGYVPSLSVNSYHLVDALGRNSVSFTITLKNGHAKTYKVELSSKSSAADITNLTGAQLYNASGTEAAFDSSVTQYYVHFDGASGNQSVTVEAAPGAAVTEFNGAAVSGMTEFALTPSVTVNTITVTAEDGVTKKLYRFVSITDGEVSGAGISEKTKQAAKSLLSEWYASLETRRDFTVGENSAGAYWQLFMAKATGLADGGEVDLNGAMVYDVSRRDMKQATDWAGSILELVMLGRNPYSFEGRDYVAGLQNAGAGAFGNNVWYLIAARAAGIEIPDSIYKNVIATAQSERADLDIRSWSIAALKGLVSDAELAAMADKLHDSQVVAGEYAPLFRNNGATYTSGNDGRNAFTVGNVLSAISAGNIDIQTQFALGDITPLSVIGSKNMVGTNKDMIIGLGDTVRGGSIYSRYALTGEKYSALISKAQELELDILTLPAFGETGYGKAFYDLLDRVVAKMNESGDTSEARAMRPDVQFGNQLQIFEERLGAGALTEAIGIYEAKLTTAQHTTLRANAALYSRYVNALAVNAGTDAGAALRKIAALPKSSELSANDKTAVAAALDAYDALDAAGKAAIDSAGASWKALLDECAAIMAQIAPDGTGSGTPSIPSVTVTFRLVGDSLHGSPDKHVRYSDWIPTRSYVFYNVERVSVYDLFMRAIRDAGLTQVGADENYVRTITKDGVPLSEFSNGSNSGWMYMVNRIHVGFGLQEQYVVDGDNIVWHYVDDYAVEEYIWEETQPGGVPDVRPDNSSNDDNPEAPADVGGAATPDRVTEIEVKAEVKDGAAAVAVKPDEVKTAVETAKNDGSAAVSVKITGADSAKTAEVSLPKESVDELKTAGLELVVDTPVAALTLDAATLAAIAETAGDGDTVTIAAEAVDGSVIELNISVGGAAITDLGGTVTVSLPYAPEETTAPDDYDLLTVYHLADDGGVIEMKGARYDAAAGKIIFATTHFSKFLISEWLSPFDDIAKGDWYYKAARYAYSNGLITGTTQTAFAPQTTLSRAMLITILARDAGIDTTGGDTWYSKAMDWGMTNTLTDGTNMNAPVTREQFATLLYRYAQWSSAGDGTSRTPSPTDADIAGFADSGDVSEYAREAMAWAVANGLMTGRTATTLAPKGTATRAEAATLLQRYLENIG